MHSDMFTVKLSSIDSRYPICLFVSSSKPYEDTSFVSANIRYYLFSLIATLSICPNFFDTSTIYSSHISNVCSLENMIHKEDFSNSFSTRFRTKQHILHHLWYVLSTELLFERMPTHILGHSYI